MKATKIENMISAAAVTTRAALAALPVTRKSELLELQILFLRAARVVDDRSLDLPMPLRGLIASKLEKSGVPALQTAKIKGFVPIGRSDRASLYDESLPPGLILIE